MTLKPYPTVDADVSSSTSETRERKQTGNMKQLGQMKRRKRKLTGLVVETQTSTK